eukprot:scaffold197576_cov18-Tisochrysis_lutea.AAC.2
MRSAGAVAVAATAAGNLCESKQCFGQGNSEGGCNDALHCVDKNQILFEELEVCIKDELMPPVHRLHGCSF